MDEQELQQMKIEYYAEFGERSSHTGGRLRGIEKFEGERENFNIYYVHLKPVKRFVNRRCLHCAHTNISFTPVG